MTHKFRVWDIERKRYIENTGNPYIFPINGITAMKCAGSSCGSIDTEKDYSEYYIIEFFTGLKDKHEVDLDWWEGDLLRDGEKIMQVIFEDGCFWGQWTKHPESRCTLMQLASWS
ncbi:hypothetical protein KAR91_57215, partial [Candidatus Pacearchaeota archaeon]|nr:hypothetical protein [Candidatus Pacearchaeota archaeon]